MNRWAGPQRGMISIDSSNIIKAAVEGAGTVGAILLTISINPVLWTQQPVGFSSPTRNNSSPKDSYIYSLSISSLIYSHFTFVWSLDACASWGVKSSVFVVMNI